MKSGLLVLFFISTFFAGFSQNLSGQWKGDFIDKSSANGSWGGDKCEYVLDLECKGTTVTGYSYTYFTDEGKRFYTICRLQGKINTQNNSLEVTEVERTKTNVPSRIRNCFQVHRLTYSSAGGDENLTGSWVPAPNQDGNCGFGTTLLERRALATSFPGFNKSASKSPTIAKNTPAKKPVTQAPLVAKNTAPVKPKTSIVAKQTPKPVTAKVTTTAQPKETTLTPNSGNASVQTVTTTAPATQPTIITQAPLNFEKRNNTLLKTLEIDNESVKVELYDNGEIDGDSISLYYNNVLLLGKKRLSDKAISLTLPVADNGTVNELVMFAENLGTIPPNTALMVVTDGTKRYEVRITSDLQKSGTIRFVHRKGN